MLSPELLAANIAALTRAQGRCPTLGALPASMRVAPTRTGVQIEVSTTSDGWQPVDAPAGGLVPPSWERQGSSPDADQIVMVGVGLGFQPQTHWPGRVLAIEPHPGIATLFLSCHDWREWFAQGRLRLLTGPDYAGASDIARFLDGLREISVVSHPLRRRWEPDVIVRAAAIAARVVKNAEANGHARRRFAGPYLVQTLANLGAIGRAANLQALDGRFAGVPAVVVGAGPSLDENVKQLAAVQDRALIVTADTALRPLLSGGVRPHVAVAVDSSALNARHLTSIDDVEGVALLAEGSVHPSAMARFAGRTFVFRVADHDPWPWLRTAGVHRAELKTWGSVLTSAFNAARRMGCDPIVFAGADLAFTGMRPYCRGTIYDAAWQEWIDKGCTWEALRDDYFSHQPEVWRNDINGVSTRTGPHLVSFRDWLVEQINGTDHGRFVNATGAGILHGARIEQASLTDVLGTRVPLGQLRRDIAACHAESRAAGNDEERILELLRLVQGAPERVPIERWVGFTAATVTPGALLAALGTAVDEVSDFRRVVGAAT